MSQDRMNTRPGRRTWPDRATDGMDPNLRFSAKFEGAEPLGSSSSNRRVNAAIAASAALLGEVSDDETARVTEQFLKQIRTGKAYLQRSTEGPTADLALGLREYLMS